ncbi:hypothetical protein RhiirA4_457251 [Rhizophagus irregularis]|uniref:Uncharacterized protein n=1 Tax=Rhizophagus irregularis TaxID=588596 RepID=A0A2I1G9I3_9GLOM|nr:hypothetical protein RhiirA4_457251 [Rhizophagus irregularis]
MEKHITQDSKKGNFYVDLLSQNFKSHMTPVMITTAEWKKLASNSIQNNNYVKWNYTYPFLIIPNGNEHLVTIEHLAQNTKIIHTINNKDDVEVDKEPSFDKFIQIIESTSKILKEQKDAENIEWLKKVEKNFKSLKKMIKDIESHNKRHTMPYTWKDYNSNTHNI